MTSIELAQYTVDHGVQLYRPRKDSPGQYDAKDFFTGSKRGWVALDTFSASAIVAVYRALNEEIKPRYAGLDPLRQARIAFSVVK